MITRHRVARSTLFVPAARPDMIAKAATSAADAVCIDLEDSVAPAAKVDARAHAVAALQTLDFGTRLRIVRINALDTPYTYRDIIDVVEAAGAQIDLLMLPKTEAAADVQFVATLLTQIEAAYQLPHPIGIAAQIETARGFVFLREIAAASERLSALIFGPGDYAASIGAPLTQIGVPDLADTSYPGHRWHAVMHAIVATARAFDLHCFDGPYAAYRDNAGLATSCASARALGFDGKQCIHPAQLATVNTAFSPTAAELAHAHDVIERYTAAQAASAGAIGVAGNMIDAANLRMAQATLARTRIGT